jgi:AcrR family transcriptional regulator
MTASSLLTTVRVSHSIDYSSGTGSSTLPTGLFYERGIHAAGVDLIVAESGADKTTLYSHFKTKDDLVAAYLERRCLLWRERLNAAVSGGDEPASQRLLRSCASSTFSATGSPNRTSAAARSSTPWRNSPPIIRPRR